MIPYLENQLLKVYIKDASNYKLANILIFPS